MKAILEFNLPEELNEYNLVNKAGDYHCVLWDLDLHLRAIIKHGDLPDKEYQIYEGIRKKLYEYLNSYNINLDE